MRDPWIGRCEAEQLLQALLPRSIGPPNGRKASRSNGLRPEAHVRHSSSAQQAAGRLYSVLAQNGSPAVWTNRPSPHRAQTNVIASATGQTIGARHESFSAFVHG